jgi:transcriptional regulator with XRE-family HTH domain
MLHHIREALVERRMTQFEAAARIGVSDTRLSRIIRERLEATDEEKRNLSKLLALPVEHLFGDARAGGRRAPLGKRGAR